MPTDFFSSFLILDRPLAPTAASRKGKKLPARAEKDARDRFVTAFLRAFEEAVPEAASSGTPARLQNLAAAAADIALGHSVVLQLKPDLAEQQRDAVRTFIEAVVRVSSTLDEDRLEAAIGKLAEVLLPDELTDARGALAADNLELRDRFIAQVPQLTSAEIRKRAGLSAKNLYATAARWKKNGDIFSIQHRGKEYFPAFQFREGRPHPTVKKALAALPSRLSPWQRAFWFVSTNGWLGDKAPIDGLDDSQAVVAAAEREGEEVAG